ncbi:hypothetical protein MYSI104531_06555 [Mycobacterium simiae]
MLGTGAAVGGGGTAVGGGATGLGTKVLTGGSGTGATDGIGGACRFSMPVSVYATPPIAVIATNADIPTISWDNRNRRHGRSRGGSITLRRIDQPAGLLSSSNASGVYGTRISPGYSVCDQANSRSVRASSSITSRSPAGSSVMSPPDDAASSPIEVRVRMSMSSPREASNSAPAAAANAGCEGDTTGRRLCTESRSFTSGMLAPPPTVTTAHRSLQPLRCRHNISSKA